MALAIVRPSTDPSADWTLQQYLEWWLDTEGARHRASTRRNNRRAVTVFAEIIGHVRLGSLTRFDLQNAVDLLLEERGWAASYVHVLWSAIATALRLAVADRVIDHNPVRRVRAPERTGRLLVLPSEADLLAFLRAALAPSGVGGKHWYGPLIAVALMTGMRRGELAGLRWANVHMDDPEAAPPDVGRLARAGAAELADRMAKGAVGVIDVLEQVDYLNFDDYAFQPPKSAHGVRRIPITPDLADVLRAQRVRVARQRLQTGTRRWTDLDLVFPSTHGTPACGKTLARTRRDIAAAVGLDPAPTFHMLRHAWVSMLVEAGVALPTIVRLAGHADGRLIERVYYGTMKRGMDAAAGAIQAQTGGAVRVLGGSFDNPWARG